MIAGTLEVQMLADIARLRTDMQKATQIMEGAGKQMENAMNKVKAAIGGLVAGLSIAALGSFIKQTIDMADHLNDLSKSTGVAVGELASLKVVAEQSGTDIDGLAKAMNKLSVEFAKDPDKFKKLGVTATDATGQLKQMADIFSKIPDINVRNALAMEAYGKTWQELAPLLSGGSKGIEEITEKTKKQAEIMGLMAPLADEVNDKWVELTASGGLLHQMIGEMLPLLSLLMDEFMKGKEDVDGLGTSFNPLMETLQAVMIVFANVKFVVQTLMGDFQALGKVLYEINRGNFSGAAGIFNGQIENAKKARDELDIYERKVMSVGQSLKAAGDTSDATSRRIVANTREQVAAAGDRATAEAQAFINADKLKAEAEAKAKKAASEAEAASKKALADAKKQAEEYNKLANAGVAEQSGYNANFIEQMKIINAESKLRNATEQEYQGIVENLLKQQPFYQENLKKNLELQKDFIAEEQKQLDKVQARTDAEVEASYAAVKSAKEELDSRGQLGSQIATITLYRLQERAAVEGMSEALRIQIQNQNELIGILKRGEIADAHEQDARKAAESWKQVSDAFVDNMMRGGKSVAQMLKDLFRTLVLNPILQPVGQAVSGAINGVLGNFGSAASSGTGLLGQAGSAVGLGAFGSGFTAGISNLGAGLGAGLSNAGAAIGAGNVAGGIGVGLGAAAPYIAVAIAIYKYFKDKEGGPKVGDYVGASTLGPNPMAIGQNDNKNAELTKMLSDRVATLNETFNKFASAFGVAGGAKFGLGASTDPEGDSPSFVEVTARNSQGQGLYSYGNTGVGRGPEALGNTLAQISIDAMVAALQNSGVDAKYIEYFHRISAGMDSEGQGKVLDTIAAIAQFTNQVADLGGSFAYITNATVDATAHFIDLAGGIDNAMGMINSYVSNFYSGIEKETKQADLISQKLMSTGLFPWATPEYIESMTRGQFKEAVDFQLKNLSNAAAGGSGEALNALLQVQGAFNELHPAAAGAADAVGEVVSHMEDLQAETKSLQAELLKATGNSAQIRALETQGYTAAEVAIYDHNAALRDQIEAANGAKQATESLTAQTNSLMAELARSNGNTGAVRAIETQGLNAAQVAIYDHNAALRAQIDATNAAKQAAQEYQNSLKSMKDETIRLTSELLNAQGNTEGAKNFDQWNMSGEQKAIDNRNRALRAEIQAVNEAKQAAEEYAAKLESLRDTTRGLQVELARAQGNAGRARQLEIESMSWAEIQIYDYNKSLEAQIKAVNDAKQAAEEYEAKLKALRDTSKSLTIELLRTQGKDAQARALEIQGLTAAEVALYDYNVALREQIDAIGEARTALEKARSQVSESYNKEAGAVKETISNLEAAIVKFRNFSKEMIKFRDSLLIGAKSPLSPLGQYDEASKQFQETYAKAMGGDETARGEVQAMANQFLDLSRENFASGSKYNEDFNRVRAALDLLGARGEDQATDAEQQLAVAKSQLEALNMMVEGIIELNINIISLASAVSEYRMAEANLDKVMNAAPGGNTQTVQAAISNAFAAWSSSHHYMPGEQASYGGSNYVATARSANVWNENSRPDYDPGNETSLWQQVGAVNPYANSPYDPTKKYFPGERAMYKGVLYQATELSRTVWNENSIETPSLWTKVPGYAMGTNYIKESGLAMLHQGESVLTREQTSQNSWRFDGGTLQAILAELKALRLAARENCEAQIQSNYDANDKAASKVVDGTAKAQSRTQFVESQARKARV